MSTGAVIARELPGWLKTLTADALERVFTAMREIDRRADYWAKRARELMPPYGTVSAWGNEHERSFVRGEALATFIRGLNKGRTPGEALEEAKRWTRESVKVHNGHYKAKAEYNFIQWEGTADSDLEDAWRKVLRAAEEHSR